MVSRRIPALPVTRTEPSLSYWPHQAHSFHDHSATYDYYKHGSMYEWYLRSASAQHRKDVRPRYYSFCPYTGQHEHSYYRF